MVGLLSLREYLYARIAFVRIDLDRAEKEGDQFKVKYVKGYRSALLTILGQVQHMINQERA